MKMPWKMVETGSPRHIRYDDMVKAAHMGSTFQWKVGAHFCVMILHSITNGGRVSVLSLHLPQPLCSSAYGKWLYRKKDKYSHLLIDVLEVSV